MKRKLSWHFYATCVVIVVAAIIVTVSFGKKEEYSYEMADLQAMRDAELTALLKWRDKLPDEPVEYWYDARTFSIIPASEPMPAPYGVGTKRGGHAVKAFESETGALFDYSEQEDYTGKVLHVLVSSKDEKLDIRVDWVANS